jgi:O-methyltransferase
MPATALDFLLKNPVFSPIRIAGWSVLTKILARRNLAIVAAGEEPFRQSAYELVRTTRTETAMMLQDSEAYNIYAAAERTRKVPGDIAELGVFRGGSARLICEVKKDRELHLFDTFAGLPKPGKFDPDFREGGFASSLEDVRKYLSPYSGVHFHPGFFPDTAAGLEASRFSFVHLDVDLYESTCSGLQWFYPRLNPGGILISHDYANAEGVRRAFEEFLADKKECLLELSGTQAAFVKIGN